MNILVTGSSGLIGSEAVRFFDAAGHRTVGFDNNMRREFFGPGGDTQWNRDRLMRSTRHFEHRDVDIRDRVTVDRIFSEEGFDAVIHCAAQPSHDRAAAIPITDFEVNALGTLNLLESMRRHSPDAAFVFLSTNKVYGDAPNELPLREEGGRWEYERSEDYYGIDEKCRIDQCLHSLFGASKASADLMAQEYGRYFGMKIGIFRGGCLTGPAHSAVEAHGFLAYLAKATVAEQPYVVYGYKGKQVRDQIHSRDVVRAFDCFIRAPRPGEVYNLGGGRRSNVSVLEAIDLIQSVAGVELRWTYSEQARRGDHICYISDTRKFESHYPSWLPTVSLTDMVKEIVAAINVAA